MVVHAEKLGFFRFGEESRSRQSNDGDVAFAGVGVFADFRGGAVAVHDGHLDVHEDEIEVFFFDDLQGFFPVVGGEHFDAELGQELLHDDLIELVVLDEEDANAFQVGVGVLLGGLQGGLFQGLVLFFGDFEGQNDPEGGAMARPVVHFHHSLLQVDEAAGDGQRQAGGGVVGVDVLLFFGGLPLSEHAFEQVGGQSFAGARDEHLEGGLGTGQFQEVHFHANFPFFGVVVGGLDQIGQDLVQADGVPDELAGDALIEPGLPLQAFFLHGHLEALFDVFEHAGGAEGAPVQFEFAGFDFGEVQDVVDENDEVVGGELQGAQVFDLVGAGVFFQQEVGGGGQGIDGRAHFVAHGGQEVVAGEAGFFDGFAVGDFVHQAAVELIELGVFVFQLPVLPFDFVRLALDAFGLDHEQAVVSFLPQVGAVNDPRQTEHQKEDEEQVEPHLAGGGVLQLQHGDLALLLFGFEFRLVFGQQIQQGAGLFLVEDDVFGPSEGFLEGIGLLEIAQLGIGVGQGGEEFGHAADGLERFQHLGALTQVVAGFRLVTQFQVDLPVVAQALGHTQRVVQFFVEFEGGGVALQGAFGVVHGELDFGDEAEVVGYAGQVFGGAVQVEGDLVVGQGAFVVAEVGGQPADVVGDLGGFFQVAGIHVQLHAFPIVFLRNAVHAFGQEDVAHPHEGFGVARTATGGRPGCEGLLEVFFGLFQVVLQIEDPPDEALASSCSAGILGLAIGFEPLHEGFQSAWIVLFVQIQLPEGFPCQGEFFRVLPLPGALESFIGQKAGPAEITLEGVAAHPRQHVHVFFLREFLHNGLDFFLEFDLREGKWGGKPKQQEKPKPIIHW